MKRVIRIICLALCLLCATSCTDDIPSFESLLNYDTFMLAHISYEDLADKKQYSACFGILSKEDVQRSSIEIELHTELTATSSHMLGASDIIQAEKPIYIFVTYPIDVTFEQLPITLTYMTTAGEEVSKDYVLDFTQQSYEDKYYKK